MVERLEAKRGGDDFEGIVESVEQEEGYEGRNQIHIKIKPTTFEVKSATGFMHEWVALPPTSTDTGVPIGSVADRYVTQLEICMPEVKRIQKVLDVFLAMKGKKFKFQRIKLGRDFEGKKAREYITPVQKL
jgi:hypothetical protein